MGKCLMLGVAVAALTAVFAGAGCGDRSRTVRGSHAGGSGGMLSSSSSSGGMGGAGGSVVVPTVYLYVDPAQGDDGQDGSEDTPLKTIRQALKLAQEGYGIRLLPGTYAQSANGESWSYSVPAGIAIEADSSKVVLENDSSNAVDGFVVSGDLLMRNIVLKGFAVALNIDTGNVELKAVDFVDGTLSLKGTAKVAVNDASAFQGSALLRAAGVAELTVSDFVSKAIASDQVFLEIDEGAVARMSGGQFMQPKIGPRMFVAKGSSQLTLDGVAILGAQFEENSQPAEHLVYGLDKSSVVLTNVNISHPTADMDANANDDSLVFLEGEAQMTVTGGSLSGGAWVIRLNGNARLGADGVAISKALTGVELESGELVMSNSNLDGCETGIFVGGESATVQLRGTKIINSLNLNVWLNPLTGAVWSIDMGNTQEVGNNTFQGAGNLGGNVLIEGVDSGIVVEMRGNTWNPSLQGADANGKYTPMEVTPPMGQGFSGENYSIFGQATLRL